MSNKVIDPRAAERRRSLLLMIGAALAVVIIAAGVIFWAIKDKKDSPAAAKLPAGTAQPTVLTGEAFRLTAAPKGTTPKAVVTLIEDFQCPACDAFEKQFGPTLEKLQSNPDVAFDYTPISFLDGSSSTFYSSRAANASVCVAEATGKDGNFDIWYKFHNELYNNQPPEGGDGLPDSDLITMAKDAGAGDLTKCITGGDYGNWVRDHTKRVKFQSTPTVRINGQDVDLQTIATPADLENKILAAAGQK
ncbi:MAG: thioredoxin domain-containing protein [Gordonia sp. (in: high G+C Gram-positive bacteria)]|uniref:DsbA family protein n=1 Tax=Gordonia sp. (in: high G+C Gram-positive bacteria) TaxID=84139 RepID=UPI0039E6DBEA